MGEARLQECGRDSLPVKAHGEQSPALRWGSGAEVGGGSLEAASTVGGAGSIPDW